MSDRDVVLSRWDGLTFTAGPAAPSGYESSVWTSPTVSAGFGATEVIPSWIAETPGGGLIRVEVSGEHADGRSTRWYNLGEWAADDTCFARTSVAGQHDADAAVHADTLVMRPGRALASWRLRVTRLWPAGSQDLPQVHQVCLMASGESVQAIPSTPKSALGKVLDVPRYAQRIHLGEYPEWDGGGISWCSATSTSMVLSYWGAGPKPADYAWVDPSYADPWVDHAARHTFDQGYHGCGNWPFNTAYAGRFGMRAFVTRLRSLNEAELFIEAGIPLIASASYQEGEVPGLDYGTEGHLMVLSGFTAAGDPVLNDPNSDSNDEVRKPVGRAEWEAAWLRSSRGVVYVIHPASVPLPPNPDQPNW